MRKSTPFSNLAFAAVATLSFSGIALGQYDPVSQLTCNPASVTSGMVTTCTVTLTAPAPAAGAKVSLSSDNALLPTVGSLTIPAGSASATFTATAGSIGSSQTATLTAAISNPVLPRTCGPGCYPQWQVVGVGDFNGDGHADVLWFDATTGSLSEWLLDGQGNVIATPILSRTSGPGCYSSNARPNVTAPALAGKGYLAYFDPYGTPP